MQGEHVSMREAVRVGWPAGVVPLVWVQAGSETQGSGLKNVSISCVQSQGPSNLQCTRQGKAKWEGQRLQWESAGRCEAHELMVQCVEGKSANIRRAKSTMVLQTCETLF